MKKICIVSDPRSKGARALVQALVDLGVDAVRASQRQPGRLSVGWGRPGDVNKRIPPNKLWELEQCRAAGVPTVPFGTLDQIAAESPLHMMGRSIRHTEGKDIGLYSRDRPSAAYSSYTRVYKGPKCTGNHDFWTAVIDKAAEYRVHVWFGKAVRYGRKIQREGDEKMIWNLRHGWKLSYGSEVPPAAYALAKAAVKACGLDFGAVDILEGKDGKLYFLEVNTKPGIEGKTIAKYADKIKILTEGS